MGRKAIVIEHQADPIDMELLAQEHAAGSQAMEIIVGQRLDVLDKFGDGTRYSREHFESVARSHLSRAGEELLMAGAALLVLKQHEGHGSFADSLRRIGVEPRLARRLMQVRLRLDKVPAASALIESAQSRSKMLELLVLDDTELQELGEGGSVAGITLDDVERMTVTELRRSIREARQNEAAHSQLLADKNTKIDQLSTQLHTRQTTLAPATSDEIGQALRKEVSAIAFETERSIRRQLAEGFEALAAHASAHDIPHHNFKAGLLAQLQQAIYDLRTEFGLPLTPDASDPLAWMNSRKGDLDSVQAEQIAIGWVRNEDGILRPPAVPQED